MYKVIQLELVEYWVLKEKIWVVNKKSISVFKYHFITTMGCYQKINLIVM